MKANGYATSGEKAFLAFPSHLSRRNKYAWFACRADLCICLDALEVNLDLAGIHPILHKQFKRFVRR